MLGWPLIFLTWLAWWLLKPARPRTLRSRAGILTVFVLGYLGGVELWLALVLNLILAPPF